MNRPLTLGLMIGILLAIDPFPLAEFAIQAQDVRPATGKDKDLLRSAPFDRITLIDDSTYEIEPLSPRPLPEPKKQTLAEKVEAARRAEERRGRKNDPFSRQENPEEDPPLVIHLLEGEPADFQVKRPSIKKIEYFDDLLLEEVDRLIKEGDYTRAFERLLIVKGRDPGWRGLEDRVNRLLFEEGTAALATENARGLRLLNDLNARKPDYPGLADSLGSSYSKRIARAIELEDFLGGRRLLRELEKNAPGHSSVDSSRERFVSLAKARFDAGMKVSGPERIDRLADAVRIWPGLPGLESAYREAFRSDPTITVAVLDLPEQVGPFPRSASADRIARLLYLPGLASDDDRAMRGEVPGQLLAGVELAELGRSLRLKVRPGQPWSDGSRPASAIDLARSLADRALPDSPGYNARWAELLDRVEVSGEDRVDVRLTRQSLKPETWLLVPIGPAHASADGWVSIADQGRMPVGNGPFRWVPDDRGILLQTSSDPGSSNIPRVRRIREVRFNDPRQGLEALKRGDVDLLEQVPPDRANELSRDSSFHLGRYSIPSVHRIALDGRTEALRNRKLRRALSLAIDRRLLLEEVLLRRPPDDLNRVADGPFVHASFVDAPDVPPLDYNPILAKGLVAAAKKELGGNPIKLTLEYPATAEARAACPKIAEAFRLIDVEIELVERAESDLESSLRSGRSFDLAYRASRPSLPLHDIGPMLIPGYDAPSASDALGSAASSRILQLLIELERAPETTSARGLALQIDRECRDELPVLPLWQLEDHFAWRSNLRGPLEASERLYQGLAEWEVEPWFADDSK
ncbi:ABC transporter substrate-binding protein [Tundrisphaera lichenicola]|uniref:ABC transporter substrate-binding protein n=1 Tax=Tundrisphaera lichenicola TaxID=2029860 RepID=UPI003EBA2A44